MTRQFDPFPAAAPVTTISVAKDFGSLPYGRLPTQDKANGQVFRDSYLIPALEQGGVEVDLSDVVGMTPSFLEEAFGGLVRCGYGPEKLAGALVIKSATDPSIRATLART